MKGKKAAGKSECVKVAIRVRPMNNHEKEQNSTICVDVDTQNNTVSVSKNDTKTFQFDYVYPMETTQRQIYDEVAFPIVDSIFQGYNGTIFAYGQTGCGKTFTMMGVVDNPDLKGIIPNAFSHIFGFIKTEGESKKFVVRCSFVEIYNEEVRDLLVAKSTKLEIREDPKKGTFVKDLTYVTLKDTQDIQKCLDRGNKNRHVGQTSMNDQSSRSHSLFTVYLEIEENNKIRSGKLNLVDLAGSERVGKTNATGQTFDEGKKINLSLTALGSVIDALSFNRKHIPYKDSKLTRLLADSLGGNTKTVMFANISPASYNYDETVGTLRYASRAKLIKNAPKINEDPKDALLRKYEEEIKALKEQLANGGEGGERRVKKKKVKKKKEKENNDNNNEENNEENNEDYEDEFGDDNDNDNKGSSNDAEKEKLREKLAELEKNLLDNKKLESTEMMISGGNLEERMKENEEENRKFKEYREQQLKLNEEMEEKLRKLEEEKKKEEESLKNDVNKLQAKIKELNTEINDLRIDNSKDRTDYNEGVKAIYRDNQFYREIIRYMLSDSELKKIIDLSKYNEEEEKWDVQSFSLKEKSLALPTMKLGNPGLASNRYQKKVSNKHIIFQNYDNNNEIEENINDENINENLISKNLSKNMSKNISNLSRNSIIIDGNNLNNVNNNMNMLPKPRNLNKRISNRRPKDISNNSGGYTNLKEYDDKVNERINLRISNDKVMVDGKRHSKSHIPALRNPVINQKFLMNNNNEPNEEELNNVNKLLMNQKERERYEALANRRNSKSINPLYGSMSNNKQLLNKLGNNKYGKIQLSPLGSNNLNNINNFNNNIGNMNMPPPLISNKKYKLAKI